MFIKIANLIGFKVTLTSIYIKTWKIVTSFQCAEQSISYISLKICKYIFISLKYWSKISVHSDHQEYFRKKGIANTAEVKIQFTFWAHLKVVKIWYPKTLLLPFFLSVIGTLERKFFFMAGSMFRILDTHQVFHTLVKVQFPLLLYMEQVANGRRAYVQEQT